MQDSPGKRILLFPSYGTDCSLYDNITFPKSLEATIIRVDWLPLEKKQTLPGYASEFISHYSITKNDIIIGTSMGGMVGIEINKKIGIHKLIIISSIKTIKEHPLLFKILRSTKAYKIVKGRLLKSVLIFIAPLYGRNIKHFGWFREVFLKTPNQFLENGLKAILFWENKEVAKNVIHIHGNNDPLFPIKNIKNVDFEIEKGTHAMVRFKADEISKILSKVLTQS